MPNYQNSKIYSVRSASRPDLIYIGGTVQSLSVRFGCHKAPSNKTKSKQIVDIGDAYIELIEHFPCNNIEELSKREGEIIRSMDCVNKQIAGRTIREWRRDNADTIKQKQRQYNLENTDTIKQKQRQYYKEHADTIKQYQSQYYSQYYIDNTDKLKQKSKQQYKKNTDKLKHRRMDNVENRTYYCKFCDKSYPTKYCLNQHMNAVFHFINYVKY